MYVCAKSRRDDGSNDEYSGEMRLEDTRDTHAKQKEVARDIKNAARQSQKFWGDIVVQIRARDHPWIVQLIL